MPEEPNETVDDRQDRDLAQAAAQRSSGIAQTGDVPAAPGERASSSAGPDPLEGGTAAGSPVAGLGISPEVAEDAVARSSDED